MVPPTTCYENVNNTKTHHACVPDKTYEKAWGVI